MVATVEEAVTICYNAIFANMGQCCCAGSRTFVHEKIYDEFVKMATAMATQRRVGNPFDPTIEQGPQVNNHKSFMSVPVEILCE